MIVYTGKRVSSSGHQPVYKIVYPENTRVELGPNPSQKLCNHSPNGFQFGYSGSGPAQLALALLLDATGDESLSFSFYQYFKWEFVSTWEDEWSISQADILIWLEQQKGLQPAIRIN